MDQVRYTEVEGGGGFCRVKVTGMIERGQKSKPPRNLYGVQRVLFSAIFPLEMTHYLPRKVKQVALLEGLGHAMSSG